MRLRPAPIPEPWSVVTEAEILPMLPPCGALGIWTVVIAKTLMLASPGRRIHPRHIFRALVSLESRGTVARDGRPASYLFTGWMLAKTQA